MQEHAFKGFNIRVIKVASHRLIVSQFKIGIIEKLSFHGFCYTLLPQPMKQKKLCELYKTTNIF